MEGNEKRNDENDWKFGTQNCFIEDQWIIWLEILKAQNIPSQWSHIE